MLFEYEPELLDATGIAAKVGEWDAIRFGKDTMRNIEAGPDGVEYLAFGAGDDPRDAEMAPNWWRE